MRNLTAAAPLRQRLHDLVYLAFWVFALCWWSEKRIVTLAALTVGGVLFGTTLFLGFLGEYRDFYEAWPLVALMAAHTVIRMMRARPVKAEL
jgi:hypothetical protein